MSDEQIDCAIAKHMGWKQLRKIQQIVSTHHGWTGIYKNTAHYEFIPEYCQDLNAIHEAEKTLSKRRGEYHTKGWGAYTMFLADINDTFTTETRLIHSTARQRAEAFLKTIGKWEQI
jgi:hypothetical protein